MKKILFVTSEAAPFSASGGLGDVMGALPGAISNQDKDACVEVILPYYESVIKPQYKEMLEKVTDLSFKLSWRTTGATVYRIKKENVNYYFIENHYYFGRSKLYGEYDDAERFAFFSLAVLEYIRKSENKPDFLHANDWQTALTVVYLKTMFAKDPAFSSIKTVFTIHNIEYQGQFDPYILGDVFALDNKYRSVVEYGGCINLMKGAITVSDFVTTVSPNYARELEYDYFAFGLADIIKSAKHKMCGIINGIDYTYFSPECGGDIYAPYTIKNIKSGKNANKTALQKELGLKVDKSIPLVAMVTRLTGGKGIDLVLHVMDEILDQNVQLVILGTGDSIFESQLQYYDRTRDNMRALIMFDRVLSKKIYAGADIFLMPSKSEPCGLAQMISCSYGTIPLVHAVGGLYDSIKPYGTDGGNGFTFDNYNAHELLFRLKDALALYQDGKAWADLVKTAKKSDFSWEKSAQEYLKIYSKD